MPGLLHAVLPQEVPTEVHLGLQGVGVILPEGLLATGQDVSIQRFGTLEVATSAQGNGQNEKLEVGTIILAIGAQQFDPTGLYGYGEKDNVLTNLELERRLGDTKDPQFGEKGTPPQSAVSSRDRTIA